MTKSRKTIRFKLTLRPPLHSNAIFRAGCQSKTSLGDAENARDVWNASPRCGPRAAAVGRPTRLKRWNRGGSNDQAIGALVCHKVPVHFNLQLNHAPSGATID